MSVYNDYLEIWEDLVGLDQQITAAKADLNNKILNHKEPGNLMGSKNAEDVKRAYDYVEKLEKIKGEKASEKEVLKAKIYGILKTVLPGFKVKHGYKIKYPKPPVKEGDIKQAIFEIRDKDRNGLGILSHLAIYFEGSEILI